MEISAEAVRELLTAAKHLDQKGIVNAIEGNVSLKRDGLIYVTPSGKNKAFLAAHAVCGLPVRTKAYAELMTVYGSFEVAPYGRPGTDDIWKGAEPLLRSSDVILLENHGALAVGPDVLQAVNHMEAAEAIARVLITSRLLGKEKDLPEEECKALLSIHEKNQIKTVS